MYDFHIFKVIIKVYIACLKKKKKKNSHVTAGHKQIGPLSLKATMVTRLVTQTPSTHGFPKKLHAK